MRFNIAVVLNIPTIRSGNIKETAWIIKQIVGQFHFVKKPQNKIVIHQSQGFIINKHQRRKLQFLQNIPGIGIEKARVLLKSLGSIEKISNASINGLSEVHGIGPKLANNIYSIIHEPYL
jgi:ERCC4-type nuclease